MSTYWYTPQSMVPLLIEIKRGNLLYHISLTLLPDQIKAKWQVRPLHKDPDLDGKEEIFKSYSEYSTWYENLKKTYGKGSFVRDYTELLRIKILDNSYLRNLPDSLLLQSVRDAYLKKNLITQKNQAGQMNYTNTKT